MPGQTGQRVTMERFRRRFWKENPKILKKLGDDYWNGFNSTFDHTSLPFFTEQRLRDLSEHFNNLEDAVKLGVNMFYDSEILWRLEKKYYSNISQMALTLFANFIINRHNGDEKTVETLIEIFFNMAKTQCAEKIKKEFDEWSQEVIVDYNDLDKTEKNWKEGFPEKNKLVFGWEEKKTPERYFDYLGNFCSLKECNKASLVDMKNYQLDNMINEILRKAPKKFAFQYLPSAGIYATHIYDKALNRKLVVEDTRKQIYTEKLLWKIAETDLDKRDFKANLLDIYNLSQASADIFEKIWIAYPRSLFMKVFKTLVYLSKETGMKDLFEMLETHKTFKPRIVKFKADCIQLYKITETAESVKD